VASFGEQALFLQMVRRDYGGYARFEVDSDHTKFGFDNEIRPTYVQVAIRLCLGRPVQISGEAIHPLEMDSLATYDAGRDGQMSWEEVLRFVLRRALDLAWPGASALTDPKKVGFTREKDR
jgi:hypothetical protein